MFKPADLKIDNANSMFKVTAFLILCCHTPQVVSATAFSSVDWNCSEENFLTGSYTFNPGSVEIDFEQSPSSLSIEQVVLQMEPSNRSQESQGFNANHIRRIPLSEDVRGRSRINRVAQMDVCLWNVIGL